MEQEAVEFERTSTAHLTDFAETAALIACLDFVITVDTGIAISRARLRVRPG
jgi:ADP-heptose:LPS heptosyltransferase